MSLLDELRERWRGPLPQPAPVSGAPDPAQESAALADLRRRRDELAEQVAELHWDLGGLAYEMAIRDHFRLDVLVRRAAILQERDAELGELERLLRMEESASAGTCPTCAALHSRGALFCWQCGTPLMERAPSSALPLPGSFAEEPTAEFERRIAGLEPQPPERPDAAPPAEGGPPPPASDSRNGTRTRSDSPSDRAPHPPEP